MTTTFDPAFDMAMNESFSRDSEFDVTARRVRDCQTGRFTGWQPGNVGAATRLLNSLGWTVTRRQGGRELVSPAGRRMDRVGRSGVIRIAREEYRRSMSQGAV